MSVIDLKPVRERILDAAAARYYSDGIRAISADKLIADAHVSKVTFYRHFPTKDDLVTAYLHGRAEDEKAAVITKREELADDPAAVLRWYAGVVGQASCSPGFRGCPFINAAAEITDETHAGRVVISDHREWLTHQVTELLEQLAVAEPTTTARQLMMLRDGAMVSGYLGNEPQEVAAALTAAARAIIGR